MNDIRASVLLVDDDPGIRQLFSTILERAGHSVTSAGSGREALELAQRATFDVAFVDFEMPGLSGIEVLRQLREMQPACARMLLTGHLDLDVALEAVNEGEILRALTKPMPSAQLLDAVRTAWEARRRLHVAFDEQSRAGEAAARSLEAAQLLDCLEGDRVRLAVQPIVRASDLAVVAHEALLRSTHPSWPGPGPLLETSERLGLLSQLGACVVRRGAEWMGRLPPGTKLFLNLHPAEFNDREALCNRLQLLEPWADRVVLEITERSELGQAEEWERSVARLTGMGFELALDDLGAGYSSLSLLAVLQPTYVKVDMSIIRNIDAVPRKQRLFNVLCRLADATGALLIAEGIETAAEAETIREQGAHLLQGYYFGMPSVEAPAFRVRETEGEFVGAGTVTLAR